MEIGKKESESESPDIKVKLVIENWISSQPVSLAPNYLASCQKVLSLGSSLRWDFVASELLAIATIDYILNKSISLQTRKTF